MWLIQKTSWQNFALSISECWYIYWMRAIRFWAAKAMLSKRILDTRFDCNNPKFTLTQTLSPKFCWKNNFKLRTKFSYVEGNPLNWNPRNSPKEATPKFTDSYCRGSTATKLSRNCQQSKENSLVSLYLTWWRIFSDSKTRYNPFRETSD